MPNQIVCVWYGDLGWLGRGTAYDPYLRELKKLGFSIDSFVNRDGQSVVNTIGARSDSRILQGIFVVGHGNSTVFGTGDGFWDFNISSEWVRYPDVGGKLQYKLGVNILWVCEGGCNGGRSLRSNYGEYVFSGVARTLIPLLDYRPMIGLFSGGKQGTNYTPIGDLDLPPYRGY